ncbi:hypothetical protein AB0M19_02005 [Streptomyces sp. NPDC051920]
MEQYRYFHESYVVELTVSPEWSLMYDERMRTLTPDVPGDFR